jgi:hypothetical protein
MAANKMGRIVVRNFSGGLNTRDHASELAKNEFPYSLNVTIDERGGAQKRLGYIRRFEQFGSGLVSNLYFWGTRGLLVSQIGTGMHVNNGIAFHSWSTPDRCGMTEFGGNLVMIHPVDGLVIYDGSSVIHTNTARRGDTLATWQNRLWVNDITLPARVWFSAPADATSFPPTNWVELREKDSAKITALGGAAGLDVSGRPGLLAFKADSAYRIYDSNTGAYNTIDTSIGCSSNIGLVNAYGRTYAVSPRGIYSTDGVNPMKEASQLVENMFAPNQINQARGDLYAAGRYQDRLFFSFPRIGENFNSVVLEHHPLQNWVVRHTNAASAYAQAGQGGSGMIFSSPTIDGMIYDSHRTGADDGAPISSSFQTRWVEPYEGNLTRIRMMRVIGRGVFDLALFKDYEVGANLPGVNVNVDPLGFPYDDPATIYDAPGVVYGPTKFQDNEDFWSIGVCRSMSMRIEETSTRSIPAQPLITDAAEEIGGWTLSHFSLLCIELGGMR